MQPSHLCEGRASPPRYTIKNSSLVWIHNSSDPQSTMVRILTAANQNSKATNQSASTQQSNPKGVGCKREKEMSENPYHVFISLDSIMLSGFNYSRINHEGLQSALIVPQNIQNYRNPRLEDQDDPQFWRKALKLKRVFYTRGEGGLK